MIVDPDFLDHWKTRTLVDILGGDELAPLYVLRIWGHCQSRRGFTFSMTPQGLRALCRCAAHTADRLESALLEAGFIERSGAEVAVPKWAEYNSKLLANWTNGKGGGRPKKQSEASGRNPLQTQLEPTETETEPTETQSEPTETQSEPIRVEKSREEKIEAVSSAAALPCPVDRLVDAYHELMPLNPRVKVLNDSRRKAIRARWLEASQLRCQPFGYGTQEGGVEAWRQFFSVCSESLFLTGRAHSQGKPPFFADLDFLMSPSGFAKCLENKYHREAA